MKRRTILVGTGTAIVGASTLLGSGAFSSVEARRTVTVETAPDANALLELTAGSSAVADEFVTGYDDGVVEIDVGPVDTDQAAPGEGVNEGSVTALLNILKVTNAGAKTVDVSATSTDGLVLVTGYTDPENYVELDARLEPTESANVGLVFNADYEGTTSVTGTVTDGENVTLVITAESVE